MKLRDQNLTWQVVGEDVVILDLQESVYLKLNGSGRVLWEALADSRTESELVAVLVGTFGIDEDRATSDVASFVGQLRGRGLIDDAQD